MNLDRFSPHNASDEIARCQSCGERFHYTQMDEEGFCPTCQPEEEETAMNEKDMMGLNAYLAEHVMKWRLVNYAIASKDSFCVMDTGVYTYASPNSMVPFSPTTDPGAAMQVLEKCVEQSPAQKLEILKAGDEWLIQYFDDPVYEVAQEQTLPLAICQIAERLFWHETKS